jgi:transcriptional regulator with XRE-family HTH domain
MSTRFNTENSAIGRIKAVMKRRKITIRQISSKSDVPYRSMQNYLSNKHVMPITVLGKVCYCLDLSPDWVLFGKHKIDSNVLTDVVQEAMGQYGTTLQIDDRSSRNLVENKIEENTRHGETRGAARAFSIVISGLYDVFKESDYFSSDYLDEDENEESSS